MTKTPDEKPRNLRVGRPPISDERMAAARALYEGTPGMTLERVARETGMNASTIGLRAKAENWRKNFGPDRQMTEAAQKAADMFKAKIEDAGPEITAEQKAVAAQEVAAELAMDERAKMLDRHRREWAAPRAMSAEAVRLRESNSVLAFERAKLAKITAETLKIVQDGERKAWGLDVGELPAGAVVVIEREAPAPDLKTVN